MISDSELKNALISSGLTEKQVKILILLYEKGLMSAQEISKETGISKVSVLYILDKLDEKDLVEKRTRYNTFIFQAQSPARILAEFDQRLTELQDKRNDIIESVQKLKQLRDYESQHKLYYYKDPHEIKRLRAGLVDAYAADKVIKDVNKKTFTEKYEGDDYIMLISVKHNIAIRVEPKEDFEKIELLFLDYLTKQ